MAYFHIIISPAVGYLFPQTFKYVVEDFNFNLLSFSLV
jgi:hypothetical protein